MADIDFIACEMCLLDVGRYRLWCGDCHAIVRARLAAVLALCGDRSILTGNIHATDLVSAAATGEADRG